MYIMTNINIQNDLVAVFDTSDNTNDVVRLSTVANNIRSGKLKVHGLGRIGATTQKSAIPLENYGIYICTNEARNAMVRYCRSKGYSRDEAMGYVTSINQ